MATQNSIPNFLFILLLLLLLVVHPSPLFSHQLISFDYIFQFGDSISDTGNFNWDDNNSLCRRFPYGMSIPGPHLPRCSDGLLIIDYFSKFFNLPINPYLEKGADFRHGVNFAVAGSTALNASVLKEKHIPSPFSQSSLDIQLNWFKSHLSFFCNNEMTECKQKLGKALIFLGEVGGNDLNFMLISRKPMEELYMLVPDVIQVIKDAAKELINLGATTMVIPGNFPIGCIPMYLSAFKTDDPTMYDELNCVKSLNGFARFYNDRLQEAIEELQQEYSHVTIVYADYYSALVWVLKNAPSLGFEKDEIQKACCGMGTNGYNFNPSQFCSREGASVCADPNKRISWDGMHFTQHAYQHMAQWLLQRLVPNILVDTNIQIA